MSRSAKRELSTDGRCGSAAPLQQSISLPVIESGAGARQPIRPSKNGKRRAVVLSLVHLLILSHIVHWWVTGTTLSPIEPSEAMEFSKRGVINAGLIFFSLALLSTLIFGRWFCGWACHMVALQDLCGWVMKKCGIRPKPFRSRTLIYVPLLLGLYMFIWPVFYRLAIAPWFKTTERLPTWAVEQHLTTSEFWATFPGWVVAIPFLAICGFACVYFLGQKGFCTYGCPYGGFFAPLDRYAPARIRVTDACEQCGHCTAVCTSNVRVHEEVRDYKMVIDPGCMKCLDCVSVCPNDALYFGFGRLPPDSAQTSDLAPVQTGRRYDMSLGEDIAVAVLFAVVFFSFRGEYARFPLLMAAGVAMVCTFILWKSWRVLRDPHANLHRFQLKLRGRMKPAGLVIVGVGAALAALVVQSGFVNGMGFVAERYDRQVRATRHAVYFDPVFTPDGAMNDAAERAIAWYDRAAMVSMNGFGLARRWRTGVDLRRAWLHSVRGDMAAAEAILREAVERYAHNPPKPVSAGLAAVLSTQPGSAEETLEWYRHALVQHAEANQSEPEPLLDEFIAWAEMTGRIEQAAEVTASRLDARPNDLHTILWLALLNLEIERAEEGIALLRRVLEINPQHVIAQELLHQAHVQYQQFDSDATSLEGNRE